MILNPKYWSLNHLPALNISLVPNKKTVGTVRALGNDMKKSIIAILSLVICGSNIFAAESSFSTCRVKSNDEYHRASAILGLEYPLGKDVVYYFELADGEYIILGEGRASTGAIEVHGGVWSITLASDTIKYLKSLKFRLLTRPPHKNELKFINVLDCEIDYSDIKYYESGEWNKDKK